MSMKDLSYGTSLCMCMVKQPEMNGGKAIADISCLVQHMLKGMLSHDFLQVIP